MSLYERGLNEVLKALLDNGYFKLRTSSFDLFFRYHLFHMTPPQLQAVLIQILIMAAT